MFSDSGLILAAGMPRSASTWLYNAARLLISNTPSIAQHFSCGWIDDLDRIPKKRYMLIKTHAYESNLVNDSSCILYSYRDIRDVIASNFRKFGFIPSIQAADLLVHQHEQWMKVSNLVMRYESMLHDKEDIIVRLIKILDLDIIDPAQLIESLEKVSYNSQGAKNEKYHNTNLYHAGHITDGRHGSWKGLVDVNLVREIEEKYKGWFEMYGYSLDD